MAIKQVSITLENMPGTLMDISERLGVEGINIRAISVSEAGKAAAVRFVTDHPAKTMNVLRSVGFEAAEKDVIAVEVPDHPGGLVAVLKPLKAAGINVLYLYPYLGRGESGQAIVIVAVDKTREAVSALKKDWVRTFGPEIYAL